MVCQKVSNKRPNRYYHFYKQQKTVSYKFSPLTTYIIEVENKAIAEDIKVDDIEVQFSIHSAPIP